LGGHNADDGAPGAGSFGTMARTRKAEGDFVHAAGGAVLREGVDGLEVVVVHRPSHDDWSLPKGKREAGETNEQCALREVLEETGYECELSVVLGTSDYVDNRGRDKQVVFFIMRPLAGEFTPNDEVDELRWLPLDEARSLLTYDRERELLERIGARTESAS
jgi:8-oxo-dGTP pyrophosphatase MutT (NUDIX family)